MGLEQKNDFQGEASEVDVSSLLSAEALNGLDNLSRISRVRGPEKRPSEGLAHPDEDLTQARGMKFSEGNSPLQGKPGDFVAEKGTRLADGNVVGAEGNSELNNIGIVDSDIPPPSSKLLPPKPLP